MAAHKTLATRVAKLGGECRVSMNVYDLLKAASEAAATGSGACTEAGIFAALDEALTRMLGGAQPPARERAAVAQSGPPTIAVFDVETKGVALPLGVIDSLSDYVATRMTESGKYQAVPRDTLKARLIEQKKSSYKQCYDQSCQIEL